MNTHFNSWLHPKDIQLILADLEAAPRRRFGQSFLVNEKAAGQIVDALELQPQDIVLEIGPGLGALTGLMMGKVQKILSIEIDIKLSAFLKKRFENFPELHLLSADCLEVDLTHILTKLTSELSSGALKVVGNLPYRISTQILFKFLECPIHPERMVMAFQWEVAERLMGKPNTKDYGALTLITRFYAEVRKLLRLKPTLFYPEPEVETGVLEFRHRVLDLGLPSDSKEQLFGLIKSGFSQRRKTLKNVWSHSPQLSFSGEKIEQALKLGGFDSKARAEDLTLQDFAKLLGILSNMINTDKY
ncbi:MAG: ribosomal RNA small subunit methyltransferase A [Chlamydiae bacterium]|nr:ribosomal RNA small subunit methyltransferase A [Chlamydiota bacterium]MBI3276653.1 ribosomal RNA small subunit methyltransferase A [Chlamydiota bacterium]